MTEFPGFQPWYVAGDPWYTHAELVALNRELERRSDERKKSAKQAKRRRR